MRKAWHIACGLVWLVGCATSPPSGPPVPVQGGIRFQLRAPEARQVSVVGTFNHWDPAASPLARKEDGTWEVVMSLPAGRHQYMFVVDGQWRAPPHAPQLVPDGFGQHNGLLVVE